MNPAVALMDESVIRDMTRVAEQTGAVNLAQGFPELPVPESVRLAAEEAVAKGFNHYTRTWGDAVLRAALARHLDQRWGLTYDAEDELTVTCGASEAIMATLLAVLRPGATAVILEPIYENYLPAVRLAGARPAVVPLDPFTGAWDVDRLEAACRGASVLVLNTPANPSGKVWTRAELEVVAELVERHDLLLVTDETYAHIVAPGVEHVPPATIGGLRRRTVTISSFSKTYAVTGWRVGFAAAPRELTRAIRTVHDFMTVCAPAPFQRALAHALELPDSYYRETAAVYRRRLELLTAPLQAAGWRVNRPDGSYFLLADLSDLDIPDDRLWAVELARTAGIAGVPGSAFLWTGLPREHGAPDRRGRFLRLSFGKRDELVSEGARRLAAWRRAEAE